MDSLKSFVENKIDEVTKTGGSEYNTPHHSNQGSVGKHGSPDINQQEAIQNASQHGSGETSLFETALGFLNNSKDDHNKPLDEAHVTDSHKKAYDEGKGGNLSADSLGSAAALQILKQFTSGGSTSHGGSNSQTQLVSLAMAEASKLFDKQQPSSGNKQDAVNSAGMTIMKLLVQSKFGGGQTAGGENSGGLSGLLNLAQKFAK